MATDTILLFVHDRPVLSSLQFALAVEGIETLDGEADECDPLAAAALVLDHGQQRDGLSALTALRARGCTAPALLLATHPTAVVHARAQALGATVIEMPLFGDELGAAIRAALKMPKAA